MAPTKKKSDRSLALAREAFLDYDFGKALELLKEAMRQDPHRGVLFCERARVKLEMHDYKGALNDAKVAAEFDVSLFLPHMIKGKAHMNLYPLDPAPAAKAFLEAERIDAVKYNAVLAAGDEVDCFLSWKAGREDFLALRFERSIVYYSQAIHKLPRSGIHVERYNQTLAAIYIDRARAYLETAKDNEALADLTVAMEAGNVPPHCYLLRGLLLMKRRFFDLARADFNSCLDGYANLHLGILPNVDLNDASTYFPPTVTESVIERLRLLINECNVDEAPMQEGDKRYTKDLSTEVRSSDDAVIDFVEVVNLYRDALFMKSTNKFLSRDFGEALILDARFKVALQAAVDLMVLDNESADCQLLKGEHLMKLKDNKNAIRSCDIGLQALEQISNRVGALTARLNELRVTCEARLQGNN